MSKGDILQGDVLMRLAEVPDASARLVIADPPYNLGPEFGNRKEFVRSEDWLPWCEKWLAECERILTHDGSIFVYGIHHFQCYIQVLMYKLGLRYRRQIIWHYENGWSRSRKTLATHYEPLLWFSKSDDYVYHEIREPYKSTERLKHNVTKNGKVWTPHPDGRMAGDVWKFPTLAGRRFKNERVDHPTQKPVSITTRIVTHFSDPGDFVVVPFAGSGTECLVAHTQGRDYLGIELNPKYVELSRQRIREVGERLPEDSQARESRR